MNLYRRLRRWVRYRRMFARATAVILDDGYRVSPEAWAGLRAACREAAGYPVRSDPG